MTQEEHDLLISLVKDVREMKTSREEDHKLILKLSDNVAVLKEDVAVLKEDVAGLKEDVAGLKEDVAVLKEDVAVLKEDVAVLKEDVAVLKEDVAVLKEDVQRLKVDVKGLNDYLVVKEEEFYDNIRILFDAREMNLDKIKENTKNIKSVKNILEKHAYRISILESKVN